MVNIEHIKDVLKPYLLTFEDEAFSFIKKNKPPPPDQVLADVNEVFNLLIIDDKKSPSRS